MNNNRIKDMAKAGFIDLLEEIIKDLKIQEIGAVRFETNLGKLAYEVGKSEGRLEGWGILINYLIKKANEQV
jgi:hypothetical protein